MLKPGQRLEVLKSTVFALNLHASDMFKVHGKGFGSTYVGGFSFKGGCLVGSVATLQVARDRLAGCSSWPLRAGMWRLKRTTQPRSPYRWQKLSKANLLHIFDLRENLLAAVVISFVAGWRLSSSMTGAVERFYLKLWTGLFYRSRSFIVKKWIDKKLNQSGVML